MCGICGYIYLNNHKSDHKKIKRMTDQLSHRGPDGEGYFVEENVALGHRRLSIIDIEGGQQPMFSEDGRFVIVFNGEIYNYIEVREELKKLDYRFSTNSDTEVIINAYLEWGEDCLSRLNGMWAFTIWDKQEKKLFAARDRMGIKPFYYGNSGNAFYFGSELKSILSAHDKWDIDYSTMELYLTFGYIPAPYTFYKNIFKLEPGHYLTLQNGKTIIRQYWDLPYVAEEDMITDKRETYEQFEALLKDSVRLRLRSDVASGAFLSGGLDSSSIVALLHELGQEGMDTFTISYPFKEYDESALAKLVAEKFNVRSNIRQVESTIFDDALKLVVKHYDEPFGDSSAIPTYYVSRFAGEKVKVVLTGDGGDEVLSGYTAYQGERFAESFNNIPTAVKKLLHHGTKQMAGITSGRLRYKLNRVRNVLDSASDDFINRRIKKAAWTNIDIINQVLSNQKDQISVRDFLNDKFKSPRYKDNFYNLMYFNFKVSLPDDMLTKVDRMTMANSIEARVPFLDHRIVEFMACVSKTVKMNSYQRKVVLRNTVGKKLPEELLKARKKGFRVPLREWFKDKEQEIRFNDILKGGIAGLDKDTLKRVFNSNRSEKEDYGNFIWMIFVLNKVISEH